MAPAMPSSHGASSRAERRALGAYAKLPLWFVPNAGQIDRRVRYYAQGAGFSFYFSKHKVVLSFEKGKRGAVLDLGFPGANPNARLEGRSELPGRVNYLKGSDPSRQHPNLPTYGEIAYRELWPGIDLVFRGQGGRLRYEFLLKPGASARDIRLAYRGARGLSLGDAGALLIDTPLGQLRDAAPHSYQRVGGRRVPVESRYSLAGGASAYGFRLASYDRSLPLVIDPSIAYSTYLGGSAFDAGQGIAIDAAGSAYVTGYTQSSDFPTTVGVFDTSLGGSFDAFVAKLSPSGSSLAYSTYLGGSADDAGWGIAVDSAGSAYVTGQAWSSDFPTTVGAFQTSRRGNNDGFVAKLTASGSGLAYSTYLGGSSFDGSQGIAVDAVGNAYVTGGTSSSDFPTVGAFDTSLGGSTAAFAAKLDASGSSLAYSTYLGGSSFDAGKGIAVDAAGSAYVTGDARSSDFPTTVGAFQTSLRGNNDGFVAKLTPSGSSLAYSTYLGGSSSDVGWGIAVDAAGSAYVLGDTSSSDLSTVGAFDTSLGGSQDAFVAKLTPSGSSLAYSTYLGGSSSDTGAGGIAVDPAGSAYVTAFTYSSDFPTTVDAFQTSLDGGEDAFVAKLSASGSSLEYSSYLGGSFLEFGRGVAVDAEGSAYVIGQTDSSDFPTTLGALDTGLGGGADAFVAKIAPITPCAVKITNGGWIVTDDADRASFGGTARETSTGDISGQEHYLDQGPGEPMDVHSLNVLTITCNSTLTTASIFGQATIDGSGSHSYRIDVQDNGEPGKGKDHYRIRLDTGYDSGDHLLRAGNVQIH
jgi:hypothetical protein